MTSNVRPPSNISAEMVASTSLGAERQNDVPRNEQRLPLGYRITSCNMDLPLLRHQPRGVASNTSSTSYIVPSSSVASASSSGFTFGEQRLMTETSSLDEEKAILLSSVGDAYGETGTDTDDSGLPTRPPSHDQFDIFSSPYDERLIVEKSSSEKMLQKHALDEVFQFAFRRGSSNDRLPSRPPDSGRGSTEQTSDGSRDIESPESLIRYRLLSEPEIVNLLSSNQSGSSEEQQQIKHEHESQRGQCPSSRPPSTSNRCSGNSYDAGSSSPSDGSPTGIENNASSSGSGTSSSGSSGTAQSPPVKGVNVDNSMNRTNQTSAGQSNMVEKR
uniref:Uncharacterized protein n=1 Tax=Anopheles culicifacies TaxID=139723 RepID=A0A182MJL6_9DIPT